MTQADISAEWYRRRADRYAEIAADPDWYTFVTHSHPNLTDELAVFDRLLPLGAAAGSSWPGPGVKTIPRSRIRRGPQFLSL